MITLDGYGLTSRQRETMVFLSSRDTAPSVEEIRRHLGLAAKSGVVRLLRGLEERGYIRRHSGRARAIELLKRVEAPTRTGGSDVAHLPLRGRIS